MFRSRSDPQVFSNSGLKGGPVFFEQFYLDIIAISGNESIYQLGDDLNIFLRNVYHIPLHEGTSFCGVHVDLGQKIGDPTHLLIASTK
jgi:hypothetical protein